MLKRSALILGFLSFLVLLIFNRYTPSSFAAGNLQNARAVLSNTDESIPNVEQLISFTLPLDSPLIATTDYILIYEPYFSNLTAATAVSGGAIGAPTFSVDGAYSKVTGISLAPGSDITIAGLRATNPSSDSQFSVTIIVSENEAGTIIKNIASVTATSYSGASAVSATLISPNAALRLTGNSAPGTFITFAENGSTIGTETAGGTAGLFTKFFAALVPDITHHVTLTGVDSQHRTTAPLTLSIYTPVYQTTHYTNILLPPTIEISDTEVIQGDNFVAQGSAVPNGTINLFTEIPLRTYIATASTLGNWDYTISDTSNYNLGDYRIYSLVQNGLGSQSIVSNSLLFSIVSAGSTSSSSPCDIGQGDLNCDTNVNLTDFSILMYYWGSTNAAADINSDGAVNLTDFSIMMYYWGT